MLSLYFDREKEYALVEGEWIFHPIGKAFIDFIGLDFTKRNIDNLSAIKENPLLNIYKEYEKIKELREENTKIIELIVNYKIAADIVLNIGNEEFKNLDINTRYYIYRTFFNKSFEDSTVQLTYLPQIKSGDFDISLESEKDYSQESLETIYKEVANMYKDAKFDMVQVYSVDTIEQALYISFMKMVEYEIKINKCKCCNQYFIPEGRIDTEYCNRIAPHSTKTCIEIGAMRKYHEKSRNNPILQEFQKQYKKMNSRVRIKKISQSDFFIWSEKARSLRDIAINENMSLDKFITELSRLED